MDQQPYFYQFLEPISKELAFVARELENSIFSSPRTMLTHARVFVENILHKVVKEEKLQMEPRSTLKELLDLLHQHDLLDTEIRNSLHFVRQIGNQAAHDTRMFRYSEALLSWEAVYKIVKWYIEVYGPVSLSVPDYQDPVPKVGQTYDISEIEAKIKGMEELLTKSLQKIEVDTAEQEIAMTTEEIKVKSELPGFTTIRKISYNDQVLEIPNFLRDSFLLPQRFSKSETFLIRLGAEQQARIMSELPNNLSGLHKHVKRYNEKNDEILFGELKIFIQEEKERRKLLLKRPGELFFSIKTTIL